MADGQVSAAEEEFRRALDANPEFAEAENDLGVLYARLGKNDEAMSLFRRATEHSPQYVAALANLGLALADQGKYDEARLELQRAVAASPGDPAAYTALGLIAETTGRDEEAVQFLTKAVELQPDSPESHLNLGNTFADRFNLAAALHEFSMAARLAPESAAAHYSQGRVLYDSQKLQEAASELEAACRFAPDDPSPLYVLALAEEQMGNLIRSAEALDRLVKLAPRDFEAQFRFGQVTLGLGKTQEAVEHWKAAAEANPDSPKVLDDLTNLLRSIRSPEASVYAERLESLQKSMRITDRVLLLEEFGVEAAKFRNWPEAAVQFKEALRLCGDCTHSAGLHRDLGVIYCRQGKLEIGVEELREAVKLNPNDPVAIKTLQVLRPLELNH